MRRLLVACSAILGVVVAISVIWRKASDRWTLPCPSLFGDLFEYDIKIGPQVFTSAHVIDHAGIQPGMRVLDVGPGPGRNSVPIGKLVGPAGEVVAFDIQPAMLRRLEDHARKEGVTNVRTINGDIGERGPEAGQFDRAIMVTVIGEVPDRVAAMQNIFDALKPGGVFSLTEALPDPHFQTRKKMEQAGRAVGFEVGPHWGRWYAYTLNLEKPSVLSS